MKLEQGKLIEQGKDGNQKAFKYLVEKHQQYAFNLAFRILCDEEDARDAVQESFIKIWKNISNYDTKTKFTTWMYTIVTNSAIDKLRSLKRMNHVRLEDQIETLEMIDERGPDVQLDNKEYGELIRSISEELPERQRLVFVLRDLQELNSDEVEKILDIDETSVKSNLYHARKAIRENLNKIFSFERRQS